MTLIRLSGNQPARARELAESLGLTADHVSVTILEVGTSEDNHSRRLNVH